MTGSPTLLKNVKSNARIIQIVPGLHIWTLSVIYSKTVDIRNSKWSFRRKVSHIKSEYFLVVMAAQVDPQNLIYPLVSGLQVQTHPLQPHNPLHQPQPQLLQDLLDVRIFRYNHTERECFPLSNCLPRWAHVN